MSSETKRTIEIKPSPVKLTMLAGDRAPDVWREPGARRRRPLRQGAGAANRL